MIEVTPEETQQAVAAGTATVVDVREPHEHEAGHIAGTEHIPLSELQARASELPQDRPVIFYCRVGGRSAMAAQAFETAGYDARSMAGGMLQWAEEGRPMSPEGGTVADHG